MASAAWLIRRSMAGEAARGQQPLEVPPLLATIAKLQADRRYRDHRQLFFVEGTRNFVEAVDHGLVIEALLYSDKDINEHVPITPQEIAADAEPSRRGRQIGTRDGCGFGAGEDKVKNYDIPGVAQYADRINVMTYDLSGAWAVNLGGMVLRNSAIRHRVQPVRQVRGGAVGGRSREPGPRCAGSLLASRLHKLGLFWLTG